MHSKPNTLETKRLVLRRWRESDLEAFAAMNADPQVMEFFPKPFSFEESKSQAERIDQHFEQHGFGLWAVEIKDVEPFAGFTGLSTPQFEAHFTPCVEIGWRLVARHWGCGYATEAARAALKFAFETANLSEVVSFTATVNHRSIRVMQRIAMTHSPSDDFDHPKVPADHILCRHVLYRIRRDEGA